MNYDRYENCGCGHRRCATDRQVTCKIQISLEAVAVSQAAETRKKSVQVTKKSRKKTGMKKKRENEERTRKQMQQQPQALPATETPFTSMYVVVETLIVGSVKIDVSKAK